MKTEAVREQLRVLNQRFHSRALLSDAFYSQVEGAGCDVERSFLVSLVPDSGNTYWGKILRQDGRVLEFDIDLDCADLSTWKDVTAEFQEGLGRRGGGVTAIRDRLAYEQAIRAHEILLEGTADSIANKLSDQHRGDK